MNGVRFALVWAVLLGASSADAVCRRTSCICLPEGTQATTGTIEATLASLEGSRANFTLETVRGSTGGLQEGGLLTLPTQTDDVVGARWLIFFAEGTFFVRRLINAGVITCGGTLPVQDASELFARTDCFDATEARGFTPPCNDVGGCTASNGLPLVALLFLGMRRARRLR